MNTFKDAMKLSTEYFNGDELAAEVFVKKYSLQHNNEFLESTPIDLHKRLSKEFARIEKNYINPISEEEILACFSNWEIVAQGSPMSGIGNTNQIQSLSNCFVVESPYDSYGGILKSDQELVQIMKRRGGVGIDISTIRPKGELTTNAAKTTDGIGVFMERYSNSCREVAQNGRRGALMITISVHHPDIETFIDIKHDTSKVTGANISIKATDEFMNAVVNDEQLHLRFPVEKDAEHTVSRYVSARDIWKKIINSAYKTADPGLLFIDTIINNSPADCYADVGFKTISTNPCGEIPLSAYDSCRLLLLNIYKFIDNPFTSRAKFNYDKFNKTARLAQRLMDDLIDLEIEAVNKIINKIKSDKEPDHIKKTELDLWNNIIDSAKNGRRTGLGITALGDALAALNITYGSNESVDKTDEIYRLLAIASYTESVNLAKERGAFAVYDYNKECNHKFISKIIKEAGIEKEYKKYGRRNIACNTTAPAGSVSILTQTTSGCENVFLLSYDRWKKMVESDTDSPDRIDEKGDRWKKFPVIHHGFKKWMEVNNKSINDIKESPYWGATSSDVDWSKKVDLQSSAQKWLDHSISITYNLPKGISIDKVEELYIKGWKTGCKGITVYVEGSKDGVLTAQDNDEIRISPKRPSSLKCDIHKTIVNGVKYIVLIGLLENKPYEIFCGLSEHIDIQDDIKTGFIIKSSAGNSAIYNLETNDVVIYDINKSFNNEKYGALTRTLSLSLRHGVPVRYIVEQLRKDRNGAITDFSKVIARVLGKNYIDDGTIVKDSCEGFLDNGDVCGSYNLAYIQGCVTCLDCGHSKCS